MSTTQDNTLFINEAPVARTSRKMIWAGRVISALPALLMIFSGVMKLMGPKEVVEGFSKMGYPDGVAIPIGIVEILCAVIYLLPQTAVLGAILLTGYLGGATDAHVRMGDSFLMPVLVGVVLWLGIYLRDARLRALLPLRNLRKTPANDI